MTPRHSQEMAGNATFLNPKPRVLVDKAEKDNIYVWGDNGRIRVSTHIFTTNDDIDYFLDRLPSYLT
jgi:selenocysteine lyase/cysteine desulfurase